MVDLERAGAARRAYGREQRQLLVAIDDDHIPTVTGPPPSTRPLVPSDILLSMFAGAAGRAAMFEVRVRLFVDVVPELSGSLTAKLEPLMRDLLEWIEREGKSTAEEREHLRRCARLRNKLFHAEFNKVTGQLNSLDAELKKESVQQFSWDDNEPLTAARLAAVLEEGGAPVGKMKQREGLMFAWLLQASQNGSFGAAARVFDEGAALLTRILDDWWASQRDDDDA